MHAVRFDEDETGEPVQLPSESRTAEDHERRFVHALQKIFRGVRVRSIAVDHGVEPEGMSKHTDYLFDNVEEINHLINWYLSSTPKLKRRAMAVGGFSDVRDETWVRLLKHCSDEWRLTTVVCQAVRWTLYVMEGHQRKQDAFEQSILRNNQPPTAHQGGTYEGMAVATAVKKELRERIDRVLKTLTYREREIIRLRYGLGDGYGYTLEEVGRIFKITRNRVREIESKAVRKMQHHTRTDLLVSFVGLPPHKVSTQ